MSKVAESEVIEVHELLHEIIRNVRKDQTIVMEMKDSFAKINVDSLDIAELILTIENRFGINAPSEMDVETYESVFNLVIKILNEEGVEYKTTPVTTPGINNTAAAKA